MNEELLKLNEEKNVSHYTGAKPDEVFVGNTETQNGVPEYLRGLTTARLGDQALDIEGKKIEPEYMRPLFIGRTEAGAYDRIMMRRVSRTVPMTPNTK